MIVYKNYRTKKKVSRMMISQRKTKCLTCKKLASNEVTTKVRLDFHRE